MTLMRWEPFHELDAMQRQMNRLFDQMMSYGMASDRRSPEGSEGFSFVPAAEIHETPEAVTLKMEVPGIDPADLDVRVTAEAVAVSGERRSELRNEDKGMRRSEFRYGRFQRIIPLPARIQNDRVQADFKNGVLHLTMPKAEEEKNRVVTINLVGQSQQDEISQSQSGHESANQAVNQPVNQSARQSARQFMSHAANRPVNQPVDHSAGQSTPNLQVS